MKSFKVLVLACMVVGCNSDSASTSERDSMEPSSSRPKDTTQVLSLFEALNGGDASNVNNKWFETRRMNKDDATRDITYYFDSTQSQNPEGSICYIDIDNLEKIAANKERARGLRLYFAQHSATRTDSGVTYPKGRFHIIVVPLDSLGDEIDFDSFNQPAIYNYNNDCPYNCPTDPPGKPKLVTNPQYTEYLRVQGRSREAKNSN